MNSGFCKEVDLFDDVKIEFQEVLTCGNVPSPCRLHSCVYFQGSLYVFGGLIIGDQYSQTRDPCKNILYEYRISTGEWSVLECQGDSPSPRIGSSLCVFEEKHLLVLYGGRFKNKDYNDLYLFNFDTKTWVKKEISTKINGLSASCVFRDGECCYVYGGFNFGARNDLYEFDISDVSKKVIPVKDMSEEIVNLKNKVEIECGVLLMKILEKDFSHTFYFLGEKNNQMRCNTYNTRNKSFNMVNIFNRKIRNSSMGFNGIQIENNGTRSLIFGGACQFWNVNEMSYLNDCDGMILIRNRENNKDQDSETLHIISGAEKKASFEFLARAFMTVVRGGVLNEKIFLFGGRKKNNNVGSNDLIRILINKNIDLTNYLINLLGEESICDVVMKFENNKLRLGHISVLLQVPMLKKRIKRVSKEFWNDTKKMKRKYEEIHYCIDLSDLFIKKYFEYLLYFLYGSLNDKMNLNIPVNEAMLFCYKYGMKLGMKHFCWFVAEYAKENLNLENCMVVEKLDEVFDENERGNYLEYVIWVFVERNLGRIKSRKNDLFLRLVEKHSGKILNFRSYGMMKKTEKDYDGEKRTETDGDDNDNEEDGEKKMMSHVDLNDYDVNFVRSYIDFFEFRDFFSDDEKKQNGLDWFKLSINERNKKKKNDYDDMEVEKKFMKSPVVVESIKTSLQNNKFLSIHFENLFMNLQGKREKDKKNKTTSSEEDLDKFDTYYNLKIFCLGDSKFVKCHKEIISSKSLYYKTFFQIYEKDNRNKFESKNEICVDNEDDNFEGIMNITESFSSEEMNDFLMFLYNGEDVRNKLMREMKIERLLRLAVLADMKLVFKLRDLCEDLIIEKIQSVKLKKQLEKKIKCYGKVFERFNQKLKSIESNNENNNGESIDDNDNKDNDDNDNNDNNDNDNDNNNNNGFFRRIVNKIWK